MLPAGHGENGVMGEAGIQISHLRTLLLGHCVVLWMQLKRAEPLEERSEELLQYKSCVGVKDHLNSLH